MYLIFSAMGVIGTLTGRRRSGWVAPHASAPNPVIARCYVPISREHPLSSADGDDTSGSEVIWHLWLAYKH